MRRTLVTAITLALAAATAGEAGLALASVGPDAPRHENFRVVGTSETATTQSIIATDSFTDGGTVALGSTVHSVATDRVQLSRGSFEVTRRIRSRTRPAPPRHCMVAVRERGTYTLSHGTGRYAGIRGTGSFDSRLILVFARAGSAGCGKTIAFQQIMYESGTSNR
jgi:hypothetical protein